MSEAQSQPSRLHAELKPASSGWQKFSRVYRGIALLCFNTALALLVAGGLFYLASSLKDKAKAVTPLDKYGSAKMQAAYPGRAKEDVAALLAETWGRPFIYERYTQFAEAPYHGKYVNVAEAGYRVVANQGPWPPAKQNLNVFVFGGSTTFGYGVADAETIPSVLQRKLGTVSGRRVCVYNFGRGYYYSTQERILFSNLLGSGVVPDATVFIDGMNEFYYRQDAPEFSGLFMRVVNREFQLRQKPAQEPEPSELIRRLPAQSTTNRTDRDTALAICRRYLRNRDLIEAMARAEGVKTVFVWQPVPNYRFDAKYYPFGEELGRHQFEQTGYEEMAELRKQGPPSTNELWLADMQEGAREPLYVDAVHYSPQMCEQVGNEIAQFMRERLLAGHSRLTSF